MIRATFKYMIGGYTGTCDGLVYYYNGRGANPSRCLPNWYNAFTRMMWRLAETHPGISLETITRAEIFSSDLPCRSVKRAVEAGLLDSVDGYELLVREM